MRWVKRGEKERGGEGERGKRGRGENKERTVSIIGFWPRTANCTATAHILQRTRSPVTHKERGKGVCNAYNACISISVYRRNTIYNA